MGGGDKQGQGTKDTQRAGCEECPDQPSLPWGGERRGWEEQDVHLGAHIRITCSAPPVSDSVGPERGVRMCVSHVPGDTDLAGQ